ncbi:MAG TPA: DUF1365 domain-containing protein [Rhodospirillaceae bacterium]|nr:DUF1365 domain-containing protein [Rhodospirillaceae bacterium]|tara:strand:+ start:1986 stop:2768 length:783 start_codon:yes stop_codon:yes gene_type:complete
MTLASAIYEGDVVHQRKRPKPHRLRYSVFSMLLDLDELPALTKVSRLFGYNRFAPLAFHDRDHGPADGTALRPWAEQHLHSAGIDPDGGPIRLLCYPRIFGYAFNPLSVFFCYRRSGALTAILYEVCNTFKERHTYVIPVADQSRPVIKQSCAKALYVSPFIGMDTSYQFRIVPPGENIRVIIRQEDSEGLLLAASFAGDRRPFSSRSLTQALIRFPLLTLKVMAGIHWEALKLWLKGLPVFKHSPAVRRVQFSIEKNGT